MILIKYINYVDFEYDIQGLIRSFYPHEQLVTNKDTEFDLMVLADFSDYTKCELNEKITFKISLLRNIMDQRLEELQTEVFDVATQFSSYEDIRKETKNRMKRALYNMLHRHTGFILPWGTLSGIRPTKISSALLENGMQKDEVFQYLKQTYYVSDAKAKESVDISEYEHEILKKIDYENGYSIYIGIPFCRSTCLYCSFTSNPISRFRDKIDQYLDAVIKELQYISHAFSHKKLNTIYIGGGTPTTLLPHQMNRLLTEISSLFDTSSLVEFTVEAGRPDSITEEILKVLKQHPVTRISINPQTMHQKTLDIIGRHHTVTQFVDAYQLARKLGFDNINMDFIIGLPDETKEDIAYSMECVKTLKPDSLTIHSLAIKRAARLNILKDKYKDYNFTNNEEIMNLTKDAACSLGLKPYYLYRQKNMAGNLENVGYAKEHKAGIYNILIMEEKQSIMAVGAGSSTKMVFPGKARIERIENVKDVDLYISRIDEMIERKADFIKEHACFRKE